MAASERASAAPSQRPNRENLYDLNARAAFAEARVAIEPQTPANRRAMATVRHAALKQDGQIPFTAFG